MNIAHEHLVSENDRLTDQVSNKDTTILTLQSEMRNVPNLKRELTMVLHLILT